MDEVELKFAVAEERLPVLLKALRTGTSRSERYQAVYFDTADELLARHGIAVRLRKEGRRWVQSLKAPDAGPMQRLEHNAAVKSPPRGELPALDLSRHDRSPAGQALTKVLTDSGQSHALIARFRTDVRRTTRDIRIGRTRIELALDVGEVVAGELSQPIREFEMELKSGPIDGLITAAANWAERHELWLVSASKAERGARLARGDAKPEPTIATAPKLPKQVDPATLFIATVTGALDQVLANAAEVGGGNNGEDFVHQLRVGLRRLRIALRELGSLATGTDPAWEPALRAAFRELGVHRDADVVLPGVWAQIESADSPSIGAPAGAGNARSSATVVRDPALQRALLGILSFVRAAPPRVAGDKTAGAHDTREFVRRRLAALFRQVKRDARRFSDLDDARQHRVRKRLKRLRYLSEFAAPLFGPKRVDRYLKRWRDAQDALGAYNDHRIAADAFRRQARHDPTAWYAVGWLAGRQQECVAQCRRALRSAAEARPFWRS